MQSSFGVTKGGDIPFAISNDNSSTFEWKITPSNLLPDIKNACASPNGQSFHSPIFTAGGFKWYLLLQVRQEKSIGLYLKSAVLPPKVKQIDVVYALRCVETNTHISNPTTFDGSNDSWGWDAGVASTTDAIAMFDTLTLRAHVAVTSIVDKKDDTVRKGIDLYNFINKNCHLFEWCVDASELQQMHCARFEQSFRSPVFTAFGCEWYLRLFPNGKTQAKSVELFLCLKCHEDIERIAVKFTLQCLESATKTETTHAFNRKNRSLGWPNHTLSSAQFHKCTADKCTFVANLEIAGIYDANDESMTDLFMFNKGGTQKTRGGGGGDGTAAGGGGCGGEDTLATAASVNAAKQEIQNTLNSVMDAIHRMENRFQTLQRQMDEVKLQHSEIRRNDAEKWDAMRDNMRVLQQRLNGVQVELEQQKQQNEHEDGNEHELEIPAPGDVSRSWLAATVGSAEHYEIVFDFIQSGLYGMPFWWLIPNLCFGTSTVAKANQSTDKCIEHDET